MQAGDIGKALGIGVGKRAGLMEAESAFKKAGSDPLKLATAMARLSMIDPSLERAAGPMYQAMLASMQGKELAGAQKTTDEFLPQAPAQIAQGRGEELAPSITERAPLEETRKPYIPREYGEIVGAASTKYPALFARDPEKAITQEMQAEQQNLARSTALQQQRKKQEDIETTVKNKLESQMKNLGIDKEKSPIAGNLFSKYQDEAIRSILPKSEGGEGLTEQQASKKYGKLIEDAARDYNVIKSWGNTYTMGPWNARNVKRQIDSTRQNFEERGDLENYADLLVGETGMSNKMGYYHAFPVKNNPDLYKEIKPPKRKFFEVVDPVGQTREISPKIAEKLRKDDSILSIAQELQFQGYDPNVWLKYVSDNRKNLDLTERQARELTKSITDIPNLQDVWFMILDRKDRLFGEK